MIKNQSSESSNLSFENAVNELEAIVKQMESHQLPLEEALTAFKRGTHLLQQSQKTLADVEQQIQLLTDDNQLQAYQDNQE
jgi:exodeoxyribonuclease VII small subunit